MRRAHYVSIALLLVACGEIPVSGPRGQAETTNAPPPSTVTVNTGDLEVIVPPGPDGELPEHLVVSCPGGPPFPLSALEEVVPVEEGDPGVAEAMRLFLDGEEGRFWPQGGWLILDQTADHALIVHEGAEGVSFMQVSKESGQWIWAGSQSGGPCPLQYAVPAGLNTVSWRLDPAAPAPGPESVEISVILNERECVGGQEIGERILGPQVVMTESAIHLAFAAKPPSGSAFDCQGNPDTSYVVELSEPLGDRVLMEGLSTGLDLEDYLD